MVHSKQVNKSWMQISWLGWSDLTVGSSAPRIPCSSLDQHFSWRWCSCVWRNRRAAGLLRPRLDISTLSPVLMVTQQDLLLWASCLHSRKRERQGAKILSKYYVSFCQKRKIFLEFLHKEKLFKAISLAKISISHGHMQLECSLVEKGHQLWGNKAPSCQTTYGWEILSSVKLYL